MYLLSRFWFWLKGWKIEGELPKGVTKAVMTAAPHTSNWDFIWARASFYILRVPLNYTIKKEFIKGPLGWILKSMGAIPIDRSPRKEGEERLSTVDAMVNLFKGRDQLFVIVTPEGTRKYASKWKTGFYYTALQAGVPIVIGFVDYKEKKAGFGPTIYPTGDIDADFEQIKAFYRTKTGKFPDQGVK